MKIQYEKNLCLSFEMSPNLIWSRAYIYTVGAAVGVPGNLRSTLKWIIGLWDIRFYTMTSSRQSVAHPEPSDRPGDGTVPFWASPLESLPSRTDGAVCTITAHGNYGFCCCLLYSLSLSRLQFLEPLVTHFFSKMQVILLCFALSSIWPNI